jgi:hypothetical protein
VDSCSISESRASIYCIKTSQLIGPALNSIGAELLQLARYYSIFDLLFTIGS